MPLFHKTASATVGTVVSVELVVLKDVAVQIQGYVAAVERLRDAETRPESNDFYISLVEATNWLTSIADRQNLTGDVDIQALRFARDRAHHQWASVVQHDANVWTWRPAAVLPEPDNPNFASMKKKPFYESRLAGHPVLEVFDRIEKVVTALPPPPA